MNVNRINLWMGIGFVTIVVAAIATWFFFFRSTASVSTNGTNSNAFNVNIPNVNNTTTAPTDTNGSQTINTTTAAQQKIFEITAGPVVGATLLQTLRPTTTIARFIRQDDGHVYDVPLGVSGAIPKIVSNITIPGGKRALWVQGGNGAVMQYLDDNLVVKTVYMGFPQATTTNAAVLPTKINFLPDNLVDIAVSPDGKSVVYLVKTANGSDGYIANADGTASRKLFSLQLSQILVSWPSQGTILAETNSATDVTGITFAINAQTGAARTLVMGDGLTAAADAGFTSVLYQTTDSSNGIRSYLHNIKSGNDYAVTPAIMPELCTDSVLQPEVRMYCASPLVYGANNAIDAWHQGAQSNSDNIFSLSLTNGVNTLITIPGSKDGGTAADILQMALSPDEHYLSYVTKGDRSLWGVLLAQ